MRTYGRVTNADGSLSWVEVQTDAQGANDLVMLTTLCQVCQLSLGESPFYASYGLPAKNSIVQQVAPDYYMALIQQQFAPFFASLSIARQAGTTPTYQVNVITHSGVVLSAKTPT
jgi:hypothetical protein